MFCDILQNTLCGALQAWKQITAFVQKTKPHQTKKTPTHVQKQKSPQAREEIKIRWAKNWKHQGKALEIITQLILACAIFS